MWQSTDPDQYCHQCSLPLSQSSAVLDEKRHVFPKSLVAHWWDGRSCAIKVEVWPQLLQTPLNVSTGEILAWTKGQYFAWMGSLHPFLFHQKQWSLGFIVVFYFLAYPLLVWYPLGHLENISQPRLPKFTSVTEDDLSQKVCLGYRIQHNDEWVSVSTDGLITISTSKTQRTQHVEKDSPKFERPCSSLGVVIGPSHHHRRLSSDMHSPRLAYLSLSFIKTIGHVKSISPAWDPKCIPKLPVFC